jgi:hypothetical protein
MNEIKLIFSSHLNTVLGKLTSHYFMLKYFKFPSVANGLITNEDLVALYCGVLT